MTFFAAYVATALATCLDESDESGGRPLDKTYSPESIAPEAIRKMTNDCNTFLAQNQVDLDASGLSTEQAAHDFWLTRNGHGAGFWDRDLGEIGKRLTNAAHAFGSSDLYIGDDGALYIFPV